MANQGNLSILNDKKAETKESASTQTLKAKIGEREFDVATLDFDKVGIVTSSMNAQVAQDIRDARRAAEQRQREAPDILAGQNPEVANVMDSIVNDMRRKGRIPQRAHAFWGIDQLHRNYPSQGYFPVQESDSAPQVRYNEMELWFCSQAQYVAQELNPDRESRSRMAALESEAEGTVKAVEGVIPALKDGQEPQPAKSGKSPLEN